MSKLIEADNVLRQITDSKNDNPFPNKAEWEMAHDCCIDIIKTADYVSPIQMPWLYLDAIKPSNFERVLFAPLENDDVLIGYYSSLCNTFSDDDGNIYHGYCWMPLPDRPE